MKWLGPFLLSLILVAACEPETIVLATLPADEVPRQVEKLRCLGTSDCPNNDFCEKAHCGARDGTCKHRPLSCQSDTRFEPVCGCSGISYINDCYRREAGDESASKDECEETAHTCDAVKNPCPTGTTCQLLGGGAVDSPTCGAPLGRCWGIITCPPPTTKGEWSECSTEPDALRCVDTCTAIQTGRNFTKTGCNH